MIFKRGQRQGIKKTPKFAVQNSEKPKAPCNITAMEVSLQNSHWRTFSIQYMPLKIIDT